MDYLLGKKEREILKKKRLRELEDNYERERSHKRSDIDLKVSRSSKNR